MPSVLRIDYVLPPVLLIAVTLAHALAALPARGDEAESAVSYDRDVRPILSDNCFSCHGFDAESRKADLRLDTSTSVTQSPGVIVPGAPDDSALIARIESSDADEVMPPPDTGRKLTSQQRQTLKRWIKQGAIFETHWAFVAPRKLDQPTATAAAHPIDKFIQLKLTEQGVSPSPAAAAETLIRRLSLDLIGLPPTVEEVDAFLNAARMDSESAYLGLVERLLASPHYGERWGRWWLDQARYADSNGYSNDNPRQIWLFRDWVVESLNSDMPFDQFTIRQLAGDLIPAATDRDRVATGFHRNTQINQEGGIDPEQFRIDSVFDRVGTTGTVWLGLTVGCAQCHDHKFDPISQREFYQLFAFFNNQDEPTLRVGSAEIRLDALTTELSKLEKRIDSAYAIHEAQHIQWEQTLTPEQRETYSSTMKEALSIPGDKRLASHKLALLTASKLTLPDEFSDAEINRHAEITEMLSRTVQTMVLQERPEPRVTTVFIKGDFTRPADLVTPGTPAVLHPLSTENQAPNRLDLANWIVDKRNPLTSRVIVNRVWQQYFGRGFVETENDFGLQGTSPSHPELLDWLAVEWMDRNWNLKELHRLIVTSHTYRQSSVARTELQQLDPLNRLLARQNRLRLDAEIVRDVALAASGMLVEKLGGPPVYPPIPDGVMNQGQVKREWKVSKGDDRYRRGLYTFVYRNTPPPSLSVFDAPEGLSSCTRRLRSNTPLQALTLLNDSSFFEFAQSLKSIVDRDGAVVAFRRCTSRIPSEDEVAVLGKLDSLGIARAILNLDETITRE